MHKYPGLSNNQTFNRGTETDGTVGQIAEANSLYCKITA